MPPEGWEDLPDTAGDLTDRERVLLAELVVLTIQPQLKPLRPYERVAEALMSIAADGMVKLVGTTTDVWVVICGRPIVHCARDWLAWTALQEERADAYN